MPLNLKQKEFLFNSIYIPIHKIHTYAKPCYKHPPLRIISHQAINIQLKKKTERKRILIIVFQYLIHIFLFISFILFMVDLHLDENHAIIRNASVWMRVDECRSFLIKQKYGEIKMNYMKHIIIECEQNTSYFIFWGVVCLWRLTFRGFWSNGVAKGVTRAIDPGAMELDILKIIWGS